MMLRLATATWFPAHAERALPATWRC